MTHYSSQQSMIFNLLANIDYSQTWDEIDNGLGYDLGDYNFGNNDKKCRELVINSAKLLWVAFNGKVNEKGDLL